MKKILYPLLIALSALAIHSCQVQPDGGDEPVPAPAGVVEMKIIASGDVDTKTALSGGSVVWGTDDKLKVFETTDNGELASVTSQAGVTTDDGMTMTFTASFPVRSASSYTYDAIYPDVASLGGVSADKININTPGRQSPSATSFDPKADLLLAQTSEPFTEQPQTLSGMRFKRMVAIADMTVKNLDSDEDITEVWFSAIDDESDVALAGNTYFNLKTGELDSKSVYGKNKADQTIALDYTGKGLKANGTAGMHAYFACYPFSLGEGDSFTVIVETATKIFTKSVTLGTGRSLALRQGGGTSFTVNMEGIVGEGKAVDLAETSVTAAQIIEANNITDQQYKNISYTGSDLAVWKGNFAREDNTVIRMRKDNDCHLKLPDFVNPIHTVTVTLTKEQKAATLSLNTQANGKGINIKNLTVSTFSETEKDIVFTLEQPYFTAYLLTTNTTYISKITVTTSADITGGGGEAFTVDGWLELPAEYDKVAMASTTTSSLNNLYQVTHRAEMNGKDVRNYTFLYDPEMFASYWVAYPLCADHMTTGREDSFGFDPVVPQNLQTNVRHGYGVQFESENYVTNSYARGHQMPNADRNNVPQMQAQSYYATNMTPQINHGFNGSIWSSLEKGVRAAVPAGDTLYVVTGAAFRKMEGNENVRNITNVNDNKTLPLPNYYWKVLLKVSRDAQGNVSAAKTIGFWIEHQEFPSGTDWRNKAFSVDQIEAWTGFDFFAALPTELQTSAEATCNLADFEIGL